MRIIHSGPINSKTALVQIRTWCRRGDKPLYKPTVALCTGAYMCHSTIMFYALVNMLDIKWCLVTWTLKHRKTHGCLVSIVATDALVLKHQAISSRNADLTFIVLDQFHIKKILHLWWTTLENKKCFEKKWPSRLRVNVFNSVHNAMYLFRFNAIDPPPIAESPPILRLEPLHCQRTGRG